MPVLTELDLGMINLVPKLFDYECIFAVRRNASWDCEAGKYWL